jgi:energy-coupling factor transport system permease protein
VTRTDALDPRAWLLWGSAASLPFLLGRNPFPLLAALLAVLGVCAAWAGAASANPRLASWAALARLAGIFAVVGAIFNVLTVPLGDRVIVEVPSGVPIVGDVVTVNALVYGLLSGAALLGLVLVGTTLGAVLDWSALLRLLPDRLMSLAVAGTVAFAFVPQTAIAFREIREAQAARGFRVRGARDLLPIIVPLLSSGLERALTLAEALEARAFGAPEAPSGRLGAWRGPMSALGLAAGATAGYLLASGRPMPAVAAGGAMALLLGLAIVERRGVRVRRTRYRVAHWGRADSAVAVASSLASVVTLSTLSRAPEALRYEPYPELALPAVDLLLLAGLGLLLVPVWFAPVPSPADEVDGRSSVPAGAPPR